MKDRLRGRQASHVLRWLIVLGCLPGIESDCVVAAPPVRQRTIDVLVLNDGTQLHGVLVPDQVQIPGQEVSKDYVRFLMRLKWANSNIAEILQAADQVPAAQPVTSLEQLLKNYIRQLEQAADTDPRQVAFLHERLAEVQARQQDVGAHSSGCVVLQVHDRLVRNRLAQSRSKRTLSSLAVVNDVDGFEELSQQDLAAKLSEIPQAELRTELPGGAAEAAKTRFQLLQLATDNLFGKTARLIQFNGKLINEDAGQDQVLQLIPDLLAGQIQKQLQDLLGEGGAVRPAGNQGLSGPMIRIPDDVRTSAENSGAQIVQVAGLHLNLTGAAATVAIHLYHKDRDSGQWRLATYSRSSATAADVPEEQTKQLMADPRIKEVLSVFETLGASDAHVTQALKMGAVVQVAQKQANAEVQRYLLDAARVSAPDPTLRVLTLERLPDPG
jgi:hypothetical protein